MNALRVLIRLTGGYGLGDVVQMGVVLKHLRRYRPTWIVDFQCKRGCESSARGLCRNVYHDDEQPPGPYDSVVELHPHDNYNNHTDRPSTKVTAALAEFFGLQWDAELGRYEIHVSVAASIKAEKYLRTITEKNTAGKFKCTLLHYQGWSSPHRKDLQDWQADAICDAVIAAGRVPVIFDWAGKSPLPDRQRIHCPGLDRSDLWGNCGCGDAEVIAAIIQHAEVFVGIDSGPSHVAGATETPSLVCWRKNHPVQFFDPCPNVVHLVPLEHRTMKPASAPGVADYFESAYAFRTYSAEHGLVSGVIDWLAETLDVPPINNAVTFVVPPSEMSAAWVLAKLQAIAGNRGAHVIVSGTVPELYERFPFVLSVRQKNVPIHIAPERPTNTRGHLLYVSDGYRKPYHYLIPDTVMQEGRPLAEWLPEYAIDWDVVNQFPENIINAMRERGWIANNSALLTS